MKRLLLVVLLLFAIPVFGADLLVGVNDDASVRVVLTDEPCSDPTVPSNILAARVYLDDQLQPAACYALMPDNRVAVMIEDGRIALVPASRFVPVRSRPMEVAPQKQPRRGPGTFGVPGVQI
jgi:hypothetical protein